MFDARQKATFTWGRGRLARNSARADVGDSRAEAEQWIRALRAGGSERENAAVRLHALLIRAARLELSRERPRVVAETLDDLATQAADNALVAILAKLDEYRFESRFTTWAYKFAVFEALTLARKRAWQRREITLDPEAWEHVAAQSADPTDAAEARERLREVAHAIQTQLTPRQRDVLTALVLNDVPIDVVAERLDTTRGAVYKTLHDARRKLRELAAEQS